MTSFHISKRLKEIRGEDIQSSDENEFQTDKQEDTQSFDVDSINQEEKENQTEDDNQTEQEDEQNESEAEKVEDSDTEKEFSFEEMSKSEIKDWAAENLDLKLHGGKSKENMIAEIEEFQKTKDTNHVG